MRLVSSEDLNLAVENVLKNIQGIDQLYPSQLELLKCMVEKENIFFTSATNSGKTLPPVIFPNILTELNLLGYNFPPNPKVLFVTALNSIQLSLVSSMNSLGLKCSAVTSENVDEILNSTISVMFISPEVMKLSGVTRVLLNWRDEFVLKVIDEAHLGTNLLKHRCG